MIIRRRHTANFTTIGNALFDDTRLSADELGVMCYLRSRPHDWEVRRPQLMKRFDIGRERMQRIMWSCISTGWIVAERTRLSTGLFSTIYEVRDEPGPALSEADVKALLTVGSAVATDDEADDCRTDHAPDHGPPDTGKPAPVEPEPVQPDTANPSWSSYKGLPNKDSLNTDSTKAKTVIAIWAQVREAWPSSDILSSLACERLFVKLSPDDRQKAADGIGPYLAACRARHRKLCDLSTYLKEKRFNGNLAVPVATFPVIGNTPQAFRWLEYWAATGKRFYPSYAESKWRNGEPYHAESEWPPAIPPRKSG